MKQTNLILEYIITGLLFLTPIVELYLILFHVTSFDFSIFSTYKEVTIAVGTVLVYIMGAVFHRLSSLITLWSMKYSTRSIGLESKYIALHQFGSVGVVDKLAYFDSLLRLYRGVTLLSPLIGIRTWIWLGRMHMTGQGFFIFLLCLFLFAASFIAHRLQVQDRAAFIDNVYDEMPGKTETNPISNRLL